MSPIGGGGPPGRALTRFRSPGTTFLHFRVVFFFVSFICLLVEGAAVDLTENVGRYGRFHLLLIAAVVEIVAQAGSTSGFAINSSHAWHIAFLGRNN